MPHCFTFAAVFAALSAHDPPAAIADQPLVVYCSADEAFARPLLAEFTQRTGITVRPLFDTEAGKTTGLVFRLLAERNRPRADVWWSSEVFGTIQLADAGILAPFDPPAASDIPDALRDPQHRWTGFALRARVLAYNPTRRGKDMPPRTWAELADPRFKGRIAMANPLFGTTRGHMAALAALWGDAAFRKYVEGLRANGVRLTDGNSQSVLLVARGDVEFAATDTDDVLVAQARGDSVDMLFPDLDAPAGSRRAGTLWIPNSAGLVAGGKNVHAAKELLDYIVSADMEWKLSRSESANLPVRTVLWDRFSSAHGKREPRIHDPSMPDAEPQYPDIATAAFARLLNAYKRSSLVDFHAAATGLRDTDALVKELLLR